MRYATILFIILILPAIGFSKDCKNPAGTPPVVSEAAEQQKAAPVLIMGQANKVHEATRLRAAPCRVSPECAAYEITVQWMTVQDWLRLRTVAPYSSPARCAATEPEPNIAVAKKKMYNAGAPPSAPPGYTIPSPPPLGNPGSSGSAPEPGKVAIATVKLFNASSPPTQERYVPEPPPLERTAQARPGLTIVSPEKGVPVFLLISKKMRQEALATRFGTLYVETPLAHQVFIGVVPPGNAYHVPLAIIPHFDAAQDIYLQALVGKRLTNLCVLRVP